MVIKYDCMCGERTLQASLCRCPDGVNFLLSNEVKNLPSKNLNNMRINLLLKFHFHYNFSTLLVIINMILLKFSCYNFGDISPKAFHSY